MQRTGVGRLKHIDIRLSGGDKDQRCKFEYEEAMKEISQVFS